MPAQSRVFRVCSRICLCLNLTGAIFKGCDKEGQEITASPPQTCFGLSLSAAPFRHTDRGVRDQPRPFCLRRRGRLNPGWRYFSPQFHVPGPILLCASPSAPHSFPPLDAGMQKQTRSHALRANTEAHLNMRRGAAGWRRAVEPWHQTGFANCEADAGHLRAR